MMKLMPIYISDCRNYRLREMICWEVPIKLTAMRLVTAYNVVIATGAAMRNNFWIVGH